MSYDVYLVIDTGGPDPVSVCEGLNYTYNCGPMFRRALGGDGLHELNDMIAADAVKRLIVGVHAMQAEPAVYRALNPSNGWGDYEGALKFLHAILDLCNAHPKATVRVS